MKKYEHGGNIYHLSACIGEEISKILDFSANINPKGPPAWIRDCLLDCWEDIVHYPDPGAKELYQSAAKQYQIQEEEVLAGNGSTELLYMLPGLDKFRQALIPVPSYVDYQKVADLHNIPVKYFYLPEDRGFRLSLPELEKHLIPESLVFLGQPNNPTGMEIDAQGLRDLANCYNKSLFVVDEAFADFIPDLDRLYRNRPANVFVLLSLTKFFAIPGIRLGLGVGDPGILERMRALSPPWSVNSLAQKIGCRALRDQEYRQESCRLLIDLKEDLYKRLNRIPDLQAFPSRVNYFLCKLHRRDLEVRDLKKYLLDKNIAIRDCSNFAGLNNRFFRMAVRSGPENDQIIQALSEILDKKSSVCITDPKEETLTGKGSFQNANARNLPAIMLQGTSSNAGKSILAAALCRIFLQDGYRVAPFKAQNMSLNSFVTRKGGEMGRAQVLQAQACKLEPDVLMNPVLLKPSSETSSQVILKGEPIKNMDVQAYIEYKEKVFSEVRDAYLELCRNRDLVILEGAGSPAEINLKQHDITNMSMAKFADARVLLTGDIDRGGVFASFVGTMSLFEDWERNLTRGFIINRFRGESSLLEPAIQETQKKTGKPILGVVPYVEELGLPEEDSVTFKAGWDKLDKSTSSPEIRIACLDLPHISNFTDLEPLIQEPDVGISIVKSPGELSSYPDVLLIPGSKNVLKDLDSLYKSGTAREIQDLANSGKSIIVGICGGFQMLGEKVADPHGIESRTESTPGLGLLPVCTELAPQKTLSQMRAQHTASRTNLQGYEIHHGNTVRLQNSVTTFARSLDGKEIGLSNSRGTICGTYLHGLFDADEFRRWFIDRVREQKGLQPLGEIQSRYDLEDNLDRLADTVRQNLDMQKIYELISE